jgi:hypothetical protein
MAAAVQRKWNYKEHDMFAKIIRTSLVVLGVAGGAFAGTAAGASGGAAGLSSLPAAGTWAQTAAPALGAAAGEWTLPAVLSGAGAANAECGNCMEASHEMGEHPAVLVARNWSKRGYDYASKMYPHPARLTLYAEAPREMGEHPAVLVARNWSKRGYDEASKIASHPALSKAAAGGVPNVAARQEPQSRLER